MATIDISSAGQLPVWRRPVALLVLMSAAMPLAFATWSALLNNFVIERAGFTGVEIGWLHTVREIPGFLSFAVVFLLLVIREQFLGILSLITLGVASAVTAYFPTFGGMLFITFIASIGFHYFETVNQSLQLQWISKERAPQVLGWLVAVGSGASLVSYGALVATWEVFNLSYNTVYLISGGACAQSAH
ncbi:MAG: MFS transporter, partial [Pseudomonadota bacterium]